MCDIIDFKTRKVVSSDALVVVASEISIQVSGENPYLVSVKKLFTVFNQSENDYIDFLEACVDKYAYQNCDEFIQSLVDGFYNISKIEV